MLVSRRKRPPARRRRRTSRASISLVFFAVNRNDCRFSLSSPRVQRSTCSEAEIVDGRCCSRRIDALFRRQSSFLVSTLARTTVAGKTISLSPSLRDRRPFFTPVFTPRLSSRTFDAFYTTSVVTRKVRESRRAEERVASPRGVLVRRARNVSTNSVQKRLTRSRSLIDEHANDVAQRCHASYARETLSYEFPRRRTPFERVDLKVSPLPDDR